MIVLSDILIPLVEFWFSDKLTTKKRGKKQKAKATNLSQFKLVYLIIK